MVLIRWWLAGHSREGSLLEYVLIEQNGTRNLCWWPLVDTPTVVKNWSTGISMSLLTYRFILLAYCLQIFSSNLLQLLV